MSHCLIKSQIQITLKYHFISNFSIKACWFLQNKMEEQIENSENDAAALEEVQVVEKVIIK